MSAFRWNRKREKAALLLAQGYTELETAKEVNSTDRTIRRWKRDLDFQCEVDRLSLMVGIASRAERLRIAMRVARQKVDRDGSFKSEKDLLDWLKFAQSETDGAKLDLAAIFEAMEAEATGGTGRG
jgi:hypothetical protein